LLPKFVKFVRVYDLLCPASIAIEKFPNQGFSSYRPWCDPKPTSTTPARAAGGQQSKVEYAVAGHIGIAGVAQGVSVSAMYIF
jgi:hypothetical protein